MGKVFSHEKLSETLEISECKDGWWLYDTTRGMNLSMKAKTKDSAFVEALHYYQKRLKEVETNYTELKGKVDSFVSQFCEEDEQSLY